MSMLYVKNIFISKLTIVKSYEWLLLIATESFDSKFVFSNSVTYYLYFSKIKIFEKKHSMYSSFSACNIDNRCSV